MELKQLAPIGVLLVVIIIALTVSQLVVAEMKTEDRLVTSTTVTNESISITNATAKALDHSLITGITAVSNYTDTLGSGNYTYTTNDDSSTITITLLDPYITTAWNVSYTYSDRTLGYNTTVEGQNSMYELADWLPLIALVVAASVIVMTVLTYFGGTFRRE